MNQHPASEMIHIQRHPGVYDVKQQHHVYYIHRRVIISEQWSCTWLIVKCFFCMHDIVAPGMFHLADQQLDNMLYTNFMQSKRLVVLDAMAVMDHSSSCITRIKV